MKKTIALIFSLFMGFQAFTQSVWVMDFVEVKNKNEAELRYFIENNWQLFREAALKEKVIKSYKVLQTTPDSSAQFSYILMTEYADSTALKLSEERFRPIMKAIRPNGPKLLNDVKPKDFRAIPISKEGTEWISSSKFDTAKHISPSDCIKWAITEDDTIGRIRNHACETLSLSQTIRNYAESMARINTKSCPLSFQTAYNRHREAWLAVLPVTDKYDDWRGEMHVLFKKLETSPDATRFKPLLKNIWDTWGEVEKAMKE